jgi:hypothetical protein
MSYDDERSLGLHVIQLTMELFGRNNKVLGFLSVEGHMTHAYLELKASAIQKQPIDIISLIKKMSGSNMSIIYSTHYINKAVL